MGSSHFAPSATMPCTDGGFSSSDSNILPPIIANHTPDVDVNTYPLTYVVNAYQSAIALSGELLGCTLLYKYSINLVWGQHLFLFPLTGCHMYIRIQSICLLVTWSDKALQ